jgi:hypothetical protein
LVGSLALSLWFCRRTRVDAVCGPHDEINSLFTLELASSSTNNESSIVIIITTTTTTAASAIRCDKPQGTHAPMNVTDKFEKGL